MIENLVLLELRLEGVPVFEVRGCFNGMNFVMVTGDIDRLVNRLFDYGLRDISEIPNDRITGVSYRKIGECLDSIFMRVYEL